MFTNLHERNNQIRTDRENGMSVKHISHKYDLCEMRIRNILKQDPEQEERTSIRTSQFGERNQEIKNLYKSGMSVKKLSQKYDLCEVRIRNIIKS